MMAQLIDDNWNTGRRSCCLTPLPRWVAEGLAAGGNVGGTCVKCGTLVTVGTDPVEGGGCLERTETEVGAAARPVQGCQKGEQWTARGWGRRWWRRRKRGLSRGVAGPCTMIALPNEIFTCSCLYADHTGNSAAVRHAAGDTNCGMNSTWGGLRGDTRVGRGRLFHDGAVRWVLGGGCSGLVMRSRNCRSHTWHGRRRRPRAGYPLHLCANTVSRVGRPVTGSPLPNPSQFFLRGGAGGARTMWADSLRDGGNRSRAQKRKRASAVGYSSRSCAARAG